MIYVPFISVFFCPCLIVLIVGRFAVVSFLLMCWSVLLSSSVKYTTGGVAPWWSVERMQFYHMKHRLLYNQISHPLVDSREKAALTDEAFTSIQPDE